MSNCRLISNEDILKIRGNDKLYSDAMESMIKFNKQLSSERKSRIPFLDQSTGIAQSNTNGMLWHERSERSLSHKTGQVFRYTAKYWFKNKRSLFDYSTASTTVGSSAIMNVNIMNESNTTNIQNSNLINSSSQILNETSNSSNISNSNNNNISQIIMKPINEQLQLLPQQQQQLTILADDWREDNYDGFQNDENDSDYDEDDYKPKRTANKKHGKHAKKFKSDIGLDEKPYTCDRCGAKYKTKPGLNYHVQKAHNGSNNNNNNITINNINNSIGTTSLKINEIINTDENANSIFDTYGDEMNSSSSMPHVSH